MLSTLFSNSTLQETQLGYTLTASFRSFFSVQGQSDQNALFNNATYGSLFNPSCPTYYDITDQIPLWVKLEKQQRELDGSNTTTLFDFAQKYYDWLYCDGEKGAQYELSKSFLDIIDIDKTQTVFLERLANIYAPGFNLNHLESNGGVVSETNLRNFLKNIRTYFYHRKTTEDGIRYFFKTLYNVPEQDVSIEVPKKFILRLNGGRFYDADFSFPKGITGSYETLGSLGGSHLNGSRIQDSNWIQDWSYLLKTGIPTNKYRESYLELAHPTGLKVVFEKTMTDYQGPTYDENTPFVCELPMIKNYSAYGISFDYGKSTAGLTYSRSWIGQGITFIGLPSTRGCTSGYTGFTGPAYLFPNWMDQPTVTNFQEINISTMLELCYMTELGSPNAQIPNCS